MQSIALYTSWSIYVGGQVTAPMQQAACLLRQLVCVVPVERVRQIYVVLRVCVECGLLSGTPNKSQKCCEIVLFDFQFINLTEM